MPVPKPKTDESEQEYISRSQMFMHKENESKPQSEKPSNEQISAICIQLGAKTKFKID